MIYKEDCRTIQELVDRVDRVDRQLKHRYVPSFTSSKDQESVDRLYSINWGPLSGMKGELSEESTILNPLAGYLLTSLGTRYKKPNPTRGWYRPDQPLEIQTKESMGLSLSIG